MVVIFSLFFDLKPKCKYLHISYQMFCKKYLCAYICGMDIPITHLAAWHHFYQNFRSSPEWDKISDAEKNALIVADRDSRGERLDPKGKQYGLGFKRVERLLTRYAPGVYEPVKIQGFILVAKK